jgi:hypothetical protein
MHALSMLVRSCCMHWAYASCSNACTERSPSKHAQHMHQELMRTLSIQVRNWCVCWAYISGIDAYPEHTHQFPTCMLSISVKIPICKGPFKTCGSCAKGTDACNERAYQELRCLQSVCIRNWCARWACESKIKRCLAPTKIRVTS